MKILAVIMLLFSLSLNAQVGIGTINPQADLDVEGSVLVQEDFSMGGLNKVGNTEEDFMLLTRSNSSIPVGEITKMDLSQLSVAPINTVNYTFTNLDGDDLTDVNLQYDASKYVVAVANFRYIGDAVKKTYLNSNADSMGTFVMRTFISGGTWHLEIGNRILNPSVIGSVDYKVTLVVYDKAYYREMPTITTNLGNSNSGAASSIPDLH